MNIRQQLSGLKKARDQTHKQIIQLPLQRSLALDDMVDAT